MYTQCPECLTIYEIDEDALQASLGIVRCGRCDKRFDALRTLSDTLPIEPVGPLPEQDPAERAPTLTDAVPPSTIERAVKKRSVQDTPTDPDGETRQEPPPAAPAPATSEAQRGESADDWFANMESELAAAPTDELSDSAPTDTNDEIWTVELPEEIGSDRVAAEIEEAAGTPVESVESGEPGESSDTVSPTPADESLQELVPEALDIDAPQDSASGDADAVCDESPRGFDPSAEDAAETDGEPRSADTSIEYAPIDAESQSTAPAPIYVRPRRRFSHASAMWAVGCVLLALLLATQLAWANRVELFRNPATHAWVARVCQSVPCNLPLIKETAKLELLSRDVRPDPNAEGALMITATVRNNAAFSQPWPIVVVQLTDLDNNPVAMRRFRPAEYMTAPARRATGIAAGATAAVAFEVADPGKRAVAFQFGFE
ncbi:MAG TPA: DUF3426 domain-containing protein [Rhodanobacteraceae bacterium]|nr:DUF3426 domain-containing protein [Rhodanobacteraceae bacterium]